MSANSSVRVRARRNARRVAVLMVTLLSLIDGRPLCAMSEQQDTKTVTDRDSGEQVVLSRDGILVVRLKATAGTGYTWQIAKLDESILQLLGEPKFEPYEAGLLGGPGDQVFHFKALASGVTALEIHYLRPWETNVPPARTFRMTVKIR